VRARTASVVRTGPGLNLFEYAIAVVYGQLSREFKTRKLSKEELGLLGVLGNAVDWYETRESEAENAAWKAARG
jgi:hypothetical protein